MEFELPMQRDDYSLVEFLKRPFADLPEIDVLEIAELKSEGVSEFEQRLNIFDNSQLFSDLFPKLEIASDLGHDLDHSIKTLTWSYASKSSNNIFDNDDPLVPLDSKSCTISAHEKTEQWLKIFDALVPAAVISPLLPLMHLRHFLNGIDVRSIDDFKARFKSYDQNWAVAALYVFLMVITYPLSHSAAFQSNRRRLIGFLDFYTQTLTSDESGLQAFWREHRVAERVVGAVLDNTTSVSDIFELLNELEEEFKDFDWEPLSFAVGESADDSEDLFDFELGYELDQNNAPQNQSHAFVEEQTSFGTNEAIDDQSSSEIFRFRVSVQGTKRSRGLEEGERATFYIPTWMPNPQLGLYSLQDYYPFLIFDAPQRSGDLMTGLTLEVSSISNSLLRDMVAQADDNSEKYQAYFSDQADCVEWRAVHDVLNGNVASILNQSDYYDYDVYETARRILIDNPEYFGWGNADPADALDEIVSSLLINGFGQSSSDEPDDHN